MPPPPRHLSRPKKALFAVFTVVGALVVLEFVARAITRFEWNSRWDQEQLVLAAEGFAELNGILAPHPTRFWQLRPGLAATRVAGTVAGIPLHFTISTDEFGHRAIPGTAGSTATVLFLGDSCTLGVGVNDDQAFPYLIQRQMRATQCVNAGVPGYTAFQGRVTLDEWDARSAGTPRPDVVVAAFGFNDSFAWNNLSDSETAEAIEQFRTNPFNQIAIVQLLQHWVGASPMAGPTKPIAQTPDEDSNGSVGTSSDAPIRERLNEAEFEEQLTAIVRRAKELGAVPILVLWPKLTIWKRAGVRYVAERNGARMVDIEEAFAASNRNDLLLDIVHASPAGHTIAANAIGPVIDAALNGTSRTHRD